MNWHTDDIWVDDYVDGAMDAAATRKVDAHLAVCERCRALVSDVRSIRAMSLSLEPHLPPPHAWTKISSAIDAAPAQAEPGRRSLFSLSEVFGWQQAAALVMATVVGTGLWWVGGHLADVSGRPGSVNVQGPVLTAGIGAMPMPLAEEQFTTAIAGLHQMTQDQQDALDADTMDVVQANLAVIDTAITESRAVLETEPGSEIAQLSLFEALRQKVVLLQDTLALINEMRKGDPDGAARIVSGLNP